MITYMINMDPYLSAWNSYVLCLRISFSRHGPNIRQLWSFSAAASLRAYKLHGNAVRVNASSYEADDRNLLSGEFYCASSYSEHVTLREIAQLPKFRSRLGIINFLIVLRQIFVIFARTIHELIVSQKALCAYELFTPVPSILAAESWYASFLPR